MSKKKKNYYNKKGMSPETKDKLKTGFATILSNEACVKASREWKGGLNAIPVVLAFVSVILALVPSFVSQMNVRGSSTVFAAPYSNADVGLSSFTYRLNHDELGNKVAEADIVHVSFNDQGELVVKNIDKLYATEVELTYPWYIDRDPATEKPAFEVFFNAGFAEEVADTDFFTRLSKGQRPDNGKERTPGNTVPETSYLAFGKQNVVFYKKAANVGLTGSYESLKGKDVLDFAPAETVPYASYEYVNQAITKWSEFIDLSYNNIKIAGTWRFTGIMAAVDLGMILFFGLILFVMTRGKNNPFRVVNYWEASKMAAWASFTPAVLALIVGFMLPQFSYLIFMFAYGMRLMWLSMKSLRPMPQ